MSITTSCPGCNALFRLPDELAGKSVRCQKCVRMFVVPALGGMAEEAPPSEPAPEMPPEPEAPTQPIAAPVEQPAVIAPQPAPPAPPPPPPEQPPSRTWLVASILSLVIALLLLLGLASIWIATHLAAPVRSMIVPPFRGVDRGDHDHRHADLRLDIVPQENIWRARFEPIALDIGQDEEVIRNEQLEFPNPDIDAAPFDQFGAFRVYRLRMEAGKTYNFHLSAPNFTARVKLIFNDVNQPLDGGSAAPRERRLLFSHQARFTGDYQIWIYSQENVARQFTLRTAVAEGTKPERINVGQMSRDELRITDAVDRLSRKMGPYREYLVRLEAGEVYHFQIESDDFTSRIQINPGNGVELNGAARGELVYRCLVTGDHRVRVTSHDCALGSYTLQINKK